MLTAVAMTFASQQPVKLSDHTAEIRIQIMDSRTHLLLKSRKVQITFSGLDGQFYNKAPYKVGHTGSDGVATFEAVEPIPPNIAVFLSDVYTCSPIGIYSTRSVIDYGVLSNWHLTGNKKADEWCTADSQAPQQQAQPGKLVIFAHPMNRFVSSWFDTFR